MTIETFETEEEFYSYFIQVTGPKPNRDTVLIFHRWDDEKASERQHKLAKRIEEILKEES